MVIGAHDPALKDGKVAFNRVRVNVAPDVLANAMIDGLMACKHAANPRAAAVTLSSI